MGGALNGEATVGTDGKAYVTVTLVADATTEGGAASAADWSASLFFMDEQADNMPTTISTAHDDSTVDFTQPLRGTLFDFMTGAIFRIFKIDV